MSTTLDNLFHGARDDFMGEFRKKIKALPEELANGTTTPEAALEELLDETFESFGEYVEEHISPSWLHRMWDPPVRFCPLALR